MQCAKTIRLMWKLKTLWLLLALSPCRNLITIVIQCSAAVFSIYLNRAIFLCRKKSDTNEWRGCVSKKAVVLRRWESITGNLVLTTPFIIPNYLINPRLLWFCLPWYVIGPKTPPLSRPIKLKSNPNSITRVFPRFNHFTGFNFAFTSYWLLRYFYFPLVDYCDYFVLGYSTLKRNRLNHKKFL